MNVRHSNVLGLYIPSFFQMELNFEFIDSRLVLYNLPETDYAVFIHEYIHFLQDISSYSLLNNAYVYSEYIHGVVNCIYKQPKGKIRVPVQMPRNYGNVDLNIFVNKTCMGEFSESENLFPLRIKTKKIKIPFQNQIVDELPIYYIESSQKQLFQFGTCAIMESMAYLIEKNIAKLRNKPSDYPYSAATMVVSLEYPEFGNNELNIIALCDMSLQFANPGKIFIQTLHAYKNANYIPQPEEIYSHMYKMPVEQLGESTTFGMGIIHMNMMVQDRLKLYLNDPCMSKFRDSIKLLLGFGTEMRLRRPMFFLDMVRQGRQRPNPTIHSTLNTIGSPVIKDINKNVYQFFPLETQPHDGLHYFLAIEQIYKCFSEGTDICEMIELCDGCPDSVTDERCYNEPWQRCNDKKLCPYAVLWKHWNLSGYIPEL